MPLWIETGGELVTRMEHETIVDVHQLARLNVQRPRYAFKRVVKPQQGILCFVISGNYHVRVKRSSDSRVSQRAAQNWVHMSFFRACGTVPPAVGLTNDEMFAI